jgi:serine/threonine-protein kinase
MFCLLAGRPPFIGKSIPDIIHQVRYTEPPLVSRFAPTTPVELEAIIGKLLEKDPKKRIPTAIALTNLLAAMANTAPQTVLDPTAEPKTADEAAFVLSSEVTKPGSAAFDAGITQRPTAILPERPPSQSPNAVETIVHTAPPHPAAAETAPSTSAPTSRFTTVPEEELGKIDVSEGDEDGRWWWLKLAGAAVAAAAFLLLIWFATRPPSADQRFAEIGRLMEENDVAAAEGEIDQFLERFPDDPRRPEIEGYRQEIEVARLERVMERRARGMRVGEGMPLVEQTYLEAMQTARKDPSRAAEQLRWLIAAFGTQAEDDDVRACIELARKQLERLEKIAEQTAAEHRQTLRQRLDAADALRDDDPNTAREIWQGLVSLYQDQPWAAEAVAEAQKRLQETSPAEAASGP